MSEIDSLLSNIGVSFGIKLPDDLLTIPHERVKGLLVKDGRFPLHDGQRIRRLPPNFPFTLVHMGKEIAVAEIETDNSMGSNNPVAYLVIKQVLIS